MKKPYYVTTPIYYVNDEPHLGHAYTTILADVLARYARLAGRETFFLTGTDEHGQKVQRAAQENGISPQAYVNKMVDRFRTTWDYLDIAYDDFIRTTDRRHKTVVATILQRLWENDGIYLGSYAGWYCVPDERFWTEKDVIDGNCPDCGRPVEWIAEDNYFFRMSEYQDWLIDYINRHPRFIQPEYRRNEVLGFLKQPLGDLCISRPADRLNWGISLPFDSKYVTYVWFDALLNYITAVDYLADSARFEKLWPQALHLVGKDILITHCVYWPTMLKAANLPMPQGIFAHGWWIIEGTKMSKSLGNVVKPLELAQIYGVDAFRYFLMRHMTLGRDANFDEHNLSLAYHTDLANDFGNLLRRVTSMIDSYHNSSVPDPAAPLAEDLGLRATIQHLAEESIALIEDMRINHALEIIMAGINGINGYLESTSPWNLARDGENQRVGTVLYFAAEALRLCSVLLHPVMPETTAALWRQIGWQGLEQSEDMLSWGQLRPGATVFTDEPLFPKIEIKH